MELLDIVDENNNLTGEKIDREIVHRKGLFHREVAVFIINEKGEILIQKRAATKKQNPNEWGLTAGHIVAGEDPIEVAIRETEEEIGIKIPKDQMNFLFVCKNEKKYSDTHYNNHFLYIYYAKTDKKESEFTIQEEELSEVKYITFEELERINKSSEEGYIFKNLDYINKSIDLIKKIL